MWSLAENTTMDLMIMGSLVHHSRQVNCMRINPYDLDQLVSCCEDGCYGVWNLRKLDLLRSVRIGSYLKEVYFIDERMIRLCGDGNRIVECFIADGVIKR